VSDPEYYSKEAISLRVFGRSSMFGDNVEPHSYYTVEDYVYEIRAAGDTGDMDFLQRVAHCLIRRVTERYYNKGIEDTKNDVRNKLGL
jgi:hypothetical protein